MASSSDGARQPLQIVLDLDHTLLQAAMAPAVGTSTQHARPVHKFMLQASDDKPNRSVVRYVLGLRDGLHEFLKEICQLATVHVYTMGSKSYATEVIGIIDPTKELIVGRVLCRRDSAPEAFVKSLTHLFPVNAEARRAALILDDRQEAWDALSREHLIQVPAFHCFDKEDNSALPRPDVPDVTLMALLRVIRVVHLDWSRGVMASAAESLRAHRQKVSDERRLARLGISVPPLHARAHAVPRADASARHAPAPSSLCHAVARARRCCAIRRSSSRAACTIRPRGRSSDCTTGYSRRSAARGARDACLRACVPPRLHASTPPRLHARAPPRLRGCARLRTCVPRSGRGRQRRTHARARADAAARLPCDGALACLFMPLRMLLRMPPPRAPPRAPSACPRPHAPVRMPPPHARYAGARKACTSGRSRTSSPASPTPTA